MTTLEHAGRFGPTLTFTLTLTLLIGACSDGAPTGPGELGPPAFARVTPGHGEPGEVLPLRIDATAALLNQVFAPDFGPPLFGKADFGERCSAPSDFVISFSLSGQAAHLGAVTGSAEHCTQIDFSTGASWIIDGQMTWVTPGGDELWATYESTPAPDGLEQVTFTGGTGRFAEATGEGIAGPDCNRATGTCTYVLQGVIAYEASNVIDD